MKPKRKLIIISLLVLVIALGLGFHWQFTSPNPEALTTLKSVSTPINDTTTRQTAKPVGYNDGSRFLQLKTVAGFLNYGFAIAGVPAFL